MSKLLASCRLHRQAMKIIQELSWQKNRNKRASTRLELRDASKYQIALEKLYGTHSNSEDLCEECAPEYDLGAFQEEDVPDSQQVIKGQRVSEKGDEPVRAEHCGVNTLLPQMHPHPWHLGHISKGFLI